jgi:protein-tyrosine-phosphatase
MECIGNYSLNKLCLKGGTTMTVGTKIKQTIASAEGVAANLKTFALDTENQQAKQLYNQLAQQMDQVVQQLKSREQQIYAEEPQYRQ